MMQRYDRIWLQKEDDCHEVTWCQDRINNDDVEYIRLDLHTAALAHERQISDDVVKDNQILRGRIERLRDALEGIRRVLAMGHTVREREADRIAQEALKEG